MPEILTPVLEKTIRADSPFAKEMEFVFESLETRVTVLSSSAEAGMDEKSSEDASVMSRIVWCISEVPRSVGCVN